MKTTTFKKQLLKNLLITTTTGLLFAACGVVGPNVPKTDIEKQAFDQGRTFYLLDQAYQCQNPQTGQTKSGYSHFVRLQKDANYSYQVCAPSVDVCQPAQVTCVAYDNATMIIAADASTMTYNGRSYTYFPQEPDSSLLMNGQNNGQVQYDVNGNPIINGTGGTTGGTTVP